VAVSRMVTFSFYGLQWIGNRNTAYLVF